MLGVSLTPSGMPCLEALLRFVQGCEPSAAHHIHMHVCAFQGSLANTWSILDASTFSSKTPLQDDICYVI
jgi:hypothetical protein